MMKSSFHQVNKPGSYEPELFMRTCVLASLHAVFRGMKTILYEVQMGHYLSETIECDFL